MIGAGFGAFCFFRFGKFGTQVTSVFLDAVLVFLRSCVTIVASDTLASVSFWFRLSLSIDSELILVQ